MKEDVNYKPPYLVPFYFVTVRNKGHIEAFIEDAGIVDAHGTVHSALISAARDPMILQSMPDANGISIKPKASERFTVYLHHGEPSFIPATCFVIDQEGRRVKDR